MSFLPTSKAAGRTVLSLFWPRKDIVGFEKHGMHGEKARTGLQIEGENANVAKSSMR